MSKKFYAAVAIMVATCAQVSLAAWDGSAKVPKVVEKDGQNFYEITSPEELIGFLDSVLVGKAGDESLKAYLKNDVVFGADTSKLCEKRWVRNKEQSMFTGDFDGRGHSIYGLNAENALFREVGMSAGSVHDVSVVHGSFGSDSVTRAASIADILDGSIWSVNVIATDVRSAYDAAGIAANVSSPYGSDGKHALILNSHVIGGSVGGSYYVGGIAGFSAGKIHGCSNSARVYTVENPNVKEQMIEHLGGIVAYSTVDFGTAIGNCVNRGKIEMESLAQWAYVGGIAGEVDGNIENLQNYGEVSSKVTFASDTAKSTWAAASYVGGIAGQHSLPRKYSGENRDLLNEGNVLAVFDNRIENGDFMVGGVVGNADRSSITNALNRGSVVAHGFGKLTKTSVGGVTGLANMNVYSGFAKLKNRGNVYGGGTFRTHVGGLAGRMEGYVVDDPKFVQSFNYGSVTGVVADTSSVSEALNVGGLLGYGDAIVFSDVYNRGKLLAKGKLVYGGSYVGGIVGLNRYPTASISNAYSATPEIAGDTVGGVVGYSLEAAVPSNTYFDKTLADVKSFGKNYFETADDPDCGRATSVLQNDEILAMLNTQNGKVADRKLWVRRGGYPVLTFDSLYKNDSLFFDLQTYALPSAEIVNDTAVYTIKTADELATLLEMGSSFGYKMFKVKLANDIVMGEDSTHLSMRKMSIDTSGLCINMMFDGQGHTVYGLNMSRAMFYCLAEGAVIDNMTIANSRFANDYGMSAAGVAISLKKNSAIRNVKIRNSLVRGGDVAGGIVANSYGTMLEVANDNTPVYASDKAGGIAGESNGFIVGASNSGKVSGRLAGGIVGYSYFNNGIVKNASNTGAILGSGEYSVAAGGIVGYSFRLQVMDALNTGLVEASSASAKVYAGGIAGRIDSSTTLDRLGNWGRVHILGGTVAYAGGLVGWYEGLPVRGLEKPTPGANFLESFNYGPVYVKTAKDSSYAGGIAGYGKFGIFHGIYNRGVVKNEGPSSKKWTGGVLASVEHGQLYSSYSYTDTLTGNGVGALVHDWQGFTYIERNYYGKGLVDAPAIVKIALDDTSKVYRNVEAKTFDELKSASMDLETGGLTWILGDCLPKLAHDTTTACKVNVVEDYFDTSFVDQIVFQENVIFADSTDNQGSGSGEGPVATPKSPVMAKAAPLSVQVVARNIALSGLSGNRPVLVMDMQGRLVKSVRAHGPSVNIAVPRAGRYIVRSGSLVHVVSVH
ncbi:peptidase A26 [Fibrobacter sp. UWB2]|uniref:peptidase A26 n=1 Tax=Fibrobacter sp. UWB2 TaxID=1964358 RepID=UPI000B525127|nr:peptidase A26 [Fibrobacter sp. UWB2]OWV23528.1 peptidase A26 [Fibrobacter sp. UWB2]